MKSRRSPFLRRPLLAALLAVMGSAVAAPVWADGQITIIHTGDFHGHLMPRPNLRSTADYPGQMVGGLARVSAQIKKIQKGKGGAGNTLVLHTGDTIQGSGEALYTRGQAIVDVVDLLGIDGFAPGNWDYVYGPERFKELFAASGKANGREADDDEGHGHEKGKDAKSSRSNRWGAIASNLYNTSADVNAPKDPTLAGTTLDTNVSPAEYDAFSEYYVNSGERVLPPFMVKKINGVKIGIIGCTTSRGPQVVGKWVTAGLEFTDCSREVPMFAEKLRTEYDVQLVVLMSEIEISRNIQLIQNKITKASQHIDVILNSDMHEETLQPIEVVDAVGNKTLIIEEGQDGTVIGELSFSVHRGKVSAPTFVSHRIDDRIKEDKRVARKVARVTYPFNKGFVANTHVNPFSGTYLNGPLSDVVGSTKIGLHRSNYANEAMPAAIEGSSHDFIADAIRWWAKSDLATVRGFRYGTHVAPGPITRNDLFHYVPIGPRVGKASRVTLNQIRNQIDNSSLAVFSRDPGNVVTPRPSYNNAAYAPSLANPNGIAPGMGLPAGGLAGNSLGWGGGWLFAYSGDGFHMDFDPYFVPSWQKVNPGPVPAPVAPATTPASGLYLADNAQITNPKTDTSRARSMTVKMLCKALPPQEIVSTGCNVADLSTRYASVMTNGTDGKYSANWAANYAVAKDTWMLNPDGWQFMKGTPNNPLGDKAVKAPFQAPSFTVAGYFYSQSPNTINNCNNCYATGYSTTVGNAEAAYLLPVNVDGNGNAALDALGNPKYVRDADGNVVMENGKPKIEGAPIDLTVVVEKYLAAIGGQVNSGNLPLNRISLQKALPAATAGFPLMQPLCGVIGNDPAAAYACP